MVNMDDKYRRDRVDIYAEMLKTLRSKSPQKLTPISNKSNLNYNRCRDYLSFLEDNHLVENNDGEYSITEKGRKFIDSYESIQEYLGKR